MAPAELSVGVQAPDFSLPASNGGTFSLAGQRGLHNVVLAFVQTAADRDTVAEAQAFRDASELLRAARTHVAFIGPDSPAAYGQLATVHALPVDFLSDADGAVARRYGVETTKAIAFVTRKVWRRSTVIIDRTGIVRKVFRDVKLDTHVNEVLAFLDTNLS